MRKPGFTLMELVAVLLIMVCLFFHSVVLTLLFGWMFFPGRIAGELAFRRDLIVWAIVLVVAATVLAHVLLRRFYAKLPADRIAEEPRRRIGWTVRVVVTFLLLLTAGFSCIGMTCMTGRILASDDSPFSGSREAARRSQSRYNLKYIGIAAHDYHDTFNSLPPGATFNRFGEKQHGWMTALLPYVEHGHIEVNRHLPWNHPDQGDAFKTRISAFLNPSLEAEQDAEGYALSHYAANCRVIGGRKPLMLIHITDGASSTILSGEVNHDLKAWGHPVNWRDPANGIKRPGGFGSSRYHRGAQFVFADGAARFISQDVDPEVLRALATPDGHEDVEDWMRR